MKKIILFAVSFLCAVATARAQQLSTGAADAGVPIEEYVPKVIVEGRWGAGPGEFGVYDEPWAGIDYRPSSLGVDSKKNIYVLDFVNERIQKFNPDGKYLKSIPVDGFSGKRNEAETTMMVDRENHDVTVPPNHPRMMEVKRKVIDIKPDFQAIGVNIVIDSKDTLYYYLKRIKDGKETGEVWEFRNDKLVKKIKVPVSTMLRYGVGLDLDRDDDSLWIPEVDKARKGRHYQFRTGKIVDTAEVNRQREVFRGTEAGRKARGRPRPKYYLDIMTSTDGVKIVEKLN